MTDGGIDFSRRRLLAALGTVGVAAASAGVGTTALFRDQERVDGNRLVAGALDLRAGFEERYANWSPDEAAGLDGDVSMQPNGTVGEAAVGLPIQEQVEGAPLVALANASDAERYLENTAGESSDPGDDAPDRAPDGFDPSAAASLAEPCDSALLASDAERPVVRLADVKPGDFGSVTVSFALCDNPGFVRAVGRLRTAAENGLTEPEREDADEDGDSGGDRVELLDAARAAVWVDDGDGYQDAGESLAVAGTLRETLTALERRDSRGPLGVLLSGNTPAEAGGGRGVNCFAAAETHSVVFAWWLPVDHANEIQSDSVTFDVGLFAEQCRHNEAPRSGRLSPSAKLLADEPTSEAFFGAAVDLDDDRLVVSADGEDPGAAYVFRDQGANGGSDGWSQSATLVSPRSGDDLFGESVAVDGETVVVGATGDDRNGSNAGAVHVFTVGPDDWSLEATLTPSAPGAGDSFGQSVAVAGDRVFVGADGEDAESGAAYVFERSDGDWRQRTRLSASDSDAEDYFGSRLATDGAGTVVVGAYGDDSAGENAGAAYVFTRADTGEWREVTKLVAPTDDAAAGDFFGSAVAVGAETVVVGAFGAEGGEYAGAAYAYSRPEQGASGDGFGPPERLSPPDPAAGEFFGWAAGLADETAVVGAYGTDGPGSDAGAAYVFDRLDDGGWRRRARVSRAEAAPDDRFGVAVAADGARAAVTADGDANVGPETGAAYVLDLGTGGGA